MYAAVRQYEIGAGVISDLMGILDAKFANSLSQQPGFAGYHAVASGLDELVTISFFEDEGSARRSNELAAEFVRDHLTGFELNLTSQMSGQVGVSRIELDAFPAEQR